MIEVLKQALEALEIAAEGGGVNFHAYAEELRQAIAEFDSHTLYREGYVNGYAFGEAAGKRQAIAESEKQDGVCQYCAGKGCVACDARKQEPVAWIEKARLDWLTKYGDEADVYTLVTKYKFGYDVPLYITPPQRTWVGLASEDRLTAKYMQDAPDGIEAVIDYIESKLKELNT